MTQLLRNACGNKILASIADADRALIDPYLEPAVLKARQRLESSNQPVKSVYFITTGLAYVMAVGRGRRHQAEFAVVGAEGMTGVPLILGADRSPNDTVVHIEGVGQSISAADLKTVMAKSQNISNALLRYAHVFCTQASYAALANARATIEERLARFLLMVHDRIAGDDLNLTHDFLATMLSVRRSSITMSLHQLAARQLLATGRGTITVLNRSGLEDAANGSYGIPEAEFARLFAPAEAPVNKIHWAVT